MPTSSSGNKYLLVVTNCFTKWVEAFPLKNIKAGTVAEVFVSQVVSRYGVPLEIHTDQGRNFESIMFRELSRLLGMKKSRTTPLHPQSNGQVERQHQTLLNFLAKFVSENQNQKDWDRWVPSGLLAYRSSKHETTGFTPAKLCQGRELKLPLDLLLGHPSRSGSGESSSRGYPFELREKFVRIHENVRQRLELKSQKSKSLYDRKDRRLSFTLGQKVWFYNPRRILGRASKLQNSWEGPYEVVKKIKKIESRLDTKTKLSI